MWMQMRMAGEETQGKTIEDKIQYTIYNIRGATYLYSVQRVNTVTECRKSTAGRQLACVLNRKSPQLAVLEVYIVHIYIYI